MLDQSNPFQPATYVTTWRRGLTMTTSIGNLAEFHAGKEKVSDYLERVSLYFEANSVAEGKQVAVLLTAIGGETYALLTNLLSPDKPRDKTFAEISSVLKKHFEPQPVIIAERFHFHRRQQGVNESVADYVAELRRLATTCEFNEYLEQLGAEGSIGVWATPRAYPEETVNRVQVNFGQSY